MRYSATLTAVILTLLCAACWDSKEGFIHLTFDVSYNVPEQTLPGDPALALLPPQELPEIPIPIDMKSDSDFSSQVFHHIVRIRLEQLIFTITGSSTDPAVDDKEPAVPTPDDWSFLESVEIWVRHPATLQEGLIAYVGAGDPQLAPGNTVLSFACLNTDISDFFDSDYKATLILRGVGTFPPDNVIFEAAAGFKVTVALIK